MSHSETIPEKPAPPSVIRRVLKWLLILAIVLLLLLSALLFITNQTVILLEPFYHLLVGWLPYLGRVIPQVQINGELLLCSLGALLLGMLGLQSLMSRLTAPTRRWRWRFTWMWCVLLIVMFCTSIAAVGIVHQTGWLFRLPKWIELTGMATQMKAVSNAKQVIMCARLYARDHNGNLPHSYADMRQEIVSDSRIFWVSVDRDMPVELLTYVGSGLHDTDDGSLPIVWSAHPSSTGKRVVGTLDGQAMVIPEAKFQEMLTTARQNPAWLKASDLPK
jgi:hypothetical protein